MDTELIRRLETFLSGEPAVQFAYLFGSRARGAPGPLSDYDLAVSVASDLPDPFDFRLKLLERLNRLLGTDRVDLVIVNEAPVLLRHRIVRDGLVLKEDRAARIDFETQAMIEYLDTAHLRERHYEVARRARSWESGGSG